MPITLEGMTKPKNSAGKSGRKGKPMDRTVDRHKKKPFQIRMHPLLRQQLEALAERNASDMTQEIVTAVREHLERAGLWPPSAKPTNADNPEPSED